MDTGQAARSDYWAGGPEWVRGKWPKVYEGLVAQSGYQAGGPK